MKCLILILISFFLLAFKGNRNKNNLEIENLKGKVKKTVEWSYYHIDENPIKRNTPKPEFGIISIYDLHGNEIEGGTYSPGDSTMSKISYKYDSNGNTIEVDEYLPHNVLAERTNYKYDAKGRITEQHVGEEGDEDVQYTYTYRYDSANMVEKDYREGVETIGKYCYRYDNNGNPLEEIYYYPVFTLYSKKTFRYDKAGNEIEYREYNTNSNLPNYHRSESFDNKGNEIEYKEFNEKDDLTRAIKYKYRYDKMGNWIKKTQIEAGKIVEIDERKIEYYP